VKNLIGIGRTEIHDDLKTLDKLTQEESWMAIIQNLTATLAVGDSVKQGEDTVVVIGNSVAGVDDRVAGLSGRVASVDNTVKGVNVIVAGVDERVGMVRDRVAEVINGA
jgi:hypothetical protein